MFILVKKKSKNGSLLLIIIDPLKALGEARFVSHNAGNALAAGAPPRTLLGELTALPQTPRLQRASALRASP